MSSSLRQVVRGVFSIAVFSIVGSTARADEIGVRVRFGLNDKQPTDWSGTVETSQGQVTAIGGWRFAAGDSIDGVKGWKTTTRRVAQQGRGNNNTKAAAAAARRLAEQRQNQGPMNDNGVLLSFADVAADTKVTVKTAQGEFSFTPGEIAYGAIVEKLDGAVEVERTAAETQITNGTKDDDYPATAVAADGTVYVAYVSFTHGDRSAYKPLQDPADNPQATANGSRGWKVVPDDFSFLANAVGGDQVMLRVRRGGKWSEPIAVSYPGGDIYKCAMTIDGQGAAWVAWSQNVEFPKKDANFEILARSFADGKPSDIVNLSQNPGSDLNPAAATDSQGRVWLAWQGVRDGAFRIIQRHQSADGFTAAEQVSTQTRNCWTPALAAAKDGRVAIAWDTYEKGDYDVWFCEFAADKKSSSEPQPAADTVDYEARPALTYDKTGALWIAYELGSPSWGKDSGPYDNGGNPLYKGRQIGLIVRDGDGKWLEPAASYLTTLPNVKPRRRINNQRVAALEPQGESPEQARAAEAQRDLAYNNLARIACDDAGRIWIFCRSRQNDFRFPLLGSLWLSFAVYYDGQAWTGPILLPHSDNLMYNTPSVAALPGGGLFVAHSSDHRQHRFPRRGNEQTIEGADDPYDNDVYVTHIEAPTEPAKPHQLKAAQYPPSGKLDPAATTVSERAAIDRCRAQKIVIAGRGLQLIRGEYHRHTEISGDGGNDGPLEDMWRYALDVSQMDWLGCGDHDNGAGREYTWWLTQKTTDAFRIPGKFEPPFTYERSVRYPEGHRNVMFVQRGVRTLPRLPITDRDFAGHAPDTQMLYKYLHHFDGVCAVHTSATSMGTDWRDNDPVVEPMVEIYQGDRQNYERPGAPRCPTEEYSIGGWEPKGFINLALAKGYRLAFQCSSDHLSTHISYAHVYAENNSREALVKAIKERHIYGSTDNIVADFRATADGVEHMMGDEFTSSQPPTLHLKLVGTEPFAKITLVKDDVEIPLPCDTKREVELSWTDPGPTAGKTSYYYVRGEQTDGELVWVSPMWIKYQPVAAGGE